MASEIDAFTFGDVVQAITSKMIRRHPHVFGDADARAADAAKGQWDRIKAEEKRARGEEPERLLDAVPVSIPPMMRAVKLQQKASTVGFDWNDPKAVLAKLREEIDEIEAELDASAPERVSDEVGDLLFAVANLARHLNVDPDQALAGTNAKFMRRFAAIEDGLAAEGRTPKDATLDEMEALWQRAKTAGNPG
jgi:ATP diphosphatase